MARRRRTWLLTITTLLMASLASVASSAAQTKITIATHFETGQIEYLQAYFDEYERLNPHVTIEHISTPFAEFLTRLEVLQASGVGPDISHLYSLWMPELRDAGLIAAPPAYVTQEIERNYVSTAVDGVSMNGQVYGIPTEINNYGLVYNKRLLAERGYANPPGDWDELIDMAKRLTDRSPDGAITQAGYAFLSGWDSAVVHPYLSLLYSDGGRLFAEGNTESLLHTTQAVTALEKQVRLFEEGATDPTVNLWGGFPGGQIAMLVMAPWWESALKTSMGESFQDVGVAPIPAGEAGSKSILYTWFWAVNDHSQNKEAAWDFLMWLNQKRAEGNTSRMGEYLVTLGIIPSRWDDIQNNPDQLFDQYTKPFIDYLESSVPEPVVYDGQAIKNILWAEIENAWHGRKPPRTALLDAKQAIDILLKEHY